MPEEARVLVDKDVACIVDEARAHDGMRSLLEEDRRQYLRDLESQGQLAMRILADRKDQQREQSLKEIDEKKARGLAAKAAKAAANAQTAPSSAPAPTEKDEPNSIFAGEDETSSLSRTTGTSTPAPHQAMGITPTTSYPPLPHPVSSSGQYLPKPEVPLSYPLFAHLHSLGYFLSPGLRFGCQYVAYPGDPLRFHSHFVVVSAEWDQEMDLMDIVNGGRLGTGVKKGFLLGGPQKRRDEVESEADRIETVRTFSIEWAGM
jgi:tRNA-splicing endonuclease subunit Sen34